MPCDLEGIYGSLAAKLPTDTGCEPFVLDETNLPLPRLELSTDTVWLRRTYIQHLPGCRGDLVDVIAERSFFRQLGLLALAVVFHECRDRVTIHVTAANSLIKQIVIEHIHWAKSKVSGFRVRPWVLGYVADEDAKVLQHGDTNFGAPMLRLTNLSDCQQSESDWQTRDTLWIGPCLATGELAEFLLNVGLESSKVGVFTVPANGTFFTADVHLWTPETWQRTQQRIREEMHKEPTRSGN